MIENNLKLGEVELKDFTKNVITEEKYDAYGFQHIPSYIIDTQGIQNPSIDRNVIINELKRRGYIIDDE